MDGDARCDVEVLGVAVPPGSEDFHHERRREAAAPGAVGHAVGRRRRRRAVPGREDRQGLPPRHVPLPPRGRRAWSARPISSTATTATRARAAARRRSRATGATPTACAGGAACPAAARSTRPPAPSSTARKLPVAAAGRSSSSRSSAYGSLAGAARSGRRSATTPPYWLAKLLAVLEGVQEARRPGRPGGDRRDDVPAAAGGPAEDARRLQGPGRLLQGEALHRHRLRRERGVGVRRRGARQDQRRAHPRRLRGPCGARARRWSTTWRTATTAWSASWACAAERHNSKLIKRLPDPENPLAAVNRLCYLLRLFLDSHTGFDRTRLGGYLDLFWAR